MDGRRWFCAQVQGTTIRSLLDVISHRIHDINSHPSIHTHRIHDSAYDDDIQPAVSKSLANSCESSRRRAPSRRTTPLSGGGTRSMSVKELRTEGGNAAEKRKATAAGDQSAVSGQADVQVAGGEREEAVAAQQQLPPPQQQQQRESNQLERAEEREGLPHAQTTHPQEREGLPHGPWVGPNYTDEGHPYWYNTITEDSSWVDPLAREAELAHEAKLAREAGLAQLSSRGSARKATAKSFRVSFAEDTAPATPPRGCAPMHDLMDGMVVFADDFTEEPAPRPSSSP